MRKGYWGGRYPRNLYQGYVGLLGGADSSIAHGRQQPVICRAIDESKC